MTDLQKSYGRVTTLRGLTPEVQRGSFYGLFGRNGAGKTTTLDCVTGLVVRDRGRVFILGEQIGLEPSPEAKRRLAYIAGHIQLFSWMTLTQHVDLIAGAYEAWDPARFDKLSGVFPLPMDRRANTLTPGQHLQFQLLMALPRHPELLILDEPGNLDPVVRARLMENMTDILHTEETTIVMASHLLDELDGVCDHMCIIEDGEALLEGPVAELTRDVREVRLTVVTFMSLLSFSERAAHRAKTIGATVAYLAWLAAGVFALGVARGLMLGWDLVETLPPLLDPWAVASTLMFWCVLLNGLQADVITRRHGSATQTFFTVLPLGISCFCSPL